MDDKSKWKAALIVVILAAGSILIVSVSTLLVKLMFGSEVAWIVLLLWIAIFASIWRQNR